MRSQNGNKNDNDDSNDEFDSLIDSKASFSERLGIDSSAGNKCFDLESCVKVRLYKLGCKCQHSYHLQRCLRP